VKAIDIARWFVAWAEHIDADVSNLKLQKLLYYAQGHRLAETGQPLFGDEIQAWAHGPVVPAVYQQYKRYGSAPVDPEAELGETFDWDDYRDLEKFLLGIWNRYGSLAAWALRERTHREPPWKDAFEANRNNTIGHAALAAFFRTHGEA
jgi:uncharacterized phage-associated protein